MKKHNAICIVLCLLFSAIQSFAQENQVSGNVTDQYNLPVIGATVRVVGTQIGTITNIDGSFTLQAPQESTEIMISYVGLETKTLPITDEPIEVSLFSTDQLIEGVVVTALNVPKEKRALSYSAQELGGEDLLLTQNTDIKSAIVGKVSGVQLNSQAGSKLGSFGKLRIRGGISLTSDSEALYVVDGVPVGDPNEIDPSNIENISVLKGPNAAALYGQRGDAGVVLITTKQAKASDGLSIELNSAYTTDRIIINQKYQNMYGQGYSPNTFGIMDFDAGALEGSYPYPEYMRAFDGARYFAGTFYSDENWGAKFDDQLYLPWYAMYEGSPYFGQQVPYSAQPDNIKNAYNVAGNLVNNIVLSKADDQFSMRISYSNKNQSGLLHNTALKKDYLRMNLDFNLTQRLQLGASANYSIQKIKGDFDDWYGNQTTGSYNSWFGRQVNTKIMRELKDFKTKEGFFINWNNWGLDRIAYAEATGNLDYKKPVFWYNPFTWLQYYQDERKQNSLIGELHGSYDFGKGFGAKLQISRNQFAYNREWRLPYSIAYSSAPDLYKSWVNSFGRDETNGSENNYQAMLTYNNEFFDKLSFDAMLGGNIRTNNYNAISNHMNKTNADNGGLILPDVYTFKNSRESLIMNTNKMRKQVNSIYSHASIGYDYTYFFDVSVRRDWSSALPENSNGYTYPSFGAAFAFSELMNSNTLSFGKLRASIAQVGDDVVANYLSPVYSLGNDQYNGQLLMYTNSRIVESNIQPAINTSYEAGLDLSFLANRLEFSSTYYNESRENEIIPITISNGTGYSSILTNAGKVNRKGVELSLNATLMKKNDFIWKLNSNWAKNESKIKDLPGDLEAIAGYNGTQGNAFGFVSVYHPLNGEWGQLRGSDFKYDNQGNKVLHSNGLYQSEGNQYLGSILPDFVGGFLNSFQYKNVSLTASFDYQKGGKFFSLTEQWGNYAGLYEATTATNENGKNVRDPVAEGGGVRVVGVNSDGEHMDMYVEAQNYFKQFYGNSIASPHIHNADYIKLRDVNVNYSIGGDLWKNKYVESASIGLIARNLWLIAVAKDNIHKWDPSELSQTYGENAQLPSTTSLGVNFKIKF